MPSFQSVGSIPSPGPTTYLGFRGYAIDKSALESADLKLLRKELTARPKIPNSPVQPATFPVYRESSSRIYVPRQYGLDEYGEPEEMRIPPGTPIDVAFTGSLRDYQINITDCYIAHVTNPATPHTGGGLLEIPCGRGKTVCALSIIARLKVKTLIVVHKGFLLNQWVERIEQFLPAARIGRIQGKTIDTANKDIVIGMLQSLSMKEYAAGTFDEFGLVVVDECHHISSEVFSRSLCNIVTRYSLGLSATMNRKDGLSDIFKMFLGKVVYTETREADDSVLVRTVRYTPRSRDPVFLTEETDFRGNVKYSTMISKLCNYNDRSEFLLRVLVSELAERPGQQIMVLAHNKSLIEYLFAAIQHRGIATVGLYVGGMKEAALKASEEKTIVIGTYAMASEGLDIKTLTTLLFATPKTDIVQSVGRILRVKHDRPLVIDVVDAHECFKRQSYKRRAFYKKERYRMERYDDEALYMNRGVRRVIDMLEDGGISRDTSRDTSCDPSRDTSCDPPPTNKCMIPLDLFAM
jgi:superfamily II DNA or RNA helicase